MSELRLMKGNEALAEAFIRAGCDAYFGYPITPQSEVLEYLMEVKPEEQTGMVVLQAESEIAAINMVFGAAGAGKKVVTTSSSPGISLMLEGISYIAGAEIPCLIANVMRGGPGLGTIQPSQADYFQSVKGGGHGDYRMIVLAPSTVQELVDFVPLGFDLAFKYRNTVMILTDGALGQMMEKVELFDHIPRSTTDEPWATVGKGKREKSNIITSLYILSEEMAILNKRLQDKYNEMEKNEVRYEEYLTNDADIVLVSFGITARICKKAIEICREKGYKIGLFRPISLFPYPKNQISKLADKVKGFLTVEMSAGQMVEDVRLAVNGKKPVEFYGTFGGIVPTPEDIVESIEKNFYSK